MCLFPPFTVPSFAIHHPSLPLPLPLPPQSSPDAKLNDLKSLLGRMLFSGNAMDKKVSLTDYHEGM